MPSVKDLYPDKWLRPQHLGNRRPTVTIEAVKVERLYNPRTRQEEPKLVIAFHKKQLRLPLNKTQSFRMAEITHTDDYTAWIGHQVVLSVARAQNGADTIAISPVPDAVRTARPAGVAVVDIGDDDENDGENDGENDDENDDEEQADATDATDAAVIDSIK